MESAIFAPWPIPQQPPGSGTDDQGLTGSQDAGRYCEGYAFSAGLNFLRYSGTFGPENALKTIGRQVLWPTL
jgi:hypothetical protein